MEQRRRRSLRLFRTLVRMAPQDRRGPQGLAPCPHSLGRGLLYDLVNQAERTSSPDLGGKVLPAGERREVQRLDARILETVEFLSPVAGGVLLSAIEPEALEVLALEQGLGGMDSWPVLGPRDKALFAAVRENVFQAPGLG